MPKLPPRTIILIALLVTVVAIANIYFYFYRSQIGSVVKKYISEITICENISDEDECYAKDFCEGIFTTSCPDCANVPKFAKCQRLSLKTATEREGQKQLCESTGGRWYRNKLGTFCLCASNGANKVFNKEEGCVSKQ
jgi:hypothetical protein